MAKVRALADCYYDHLLRRAGDVFEMAPDPAPNPPFPEHVEVLSGGPKVNPKKVLTAKEKALNEARADTVRVGRRDAATVDDIVEDEEVTYEDDTADEGDDTSDEVDGDEPDAEEPEEEDEAEAPAPKPKGVKKAKPAGRRVKKKKARVT